MKRYGSSLETKGINVKNKKPIFTSPLFLTNVDNRLVFDQQLNVDQTVVYCKKYSKRSEFMSEPKVKDVITNKKEHAFKDMDYYSIYLADASMNEAYDFI